MRKSPSVDTMPQFEPLTVRASNLMLAAKSHRSKNDVFEAAVSWMEAGRTLAELGSRLIHADHAYEGAQDVLHAAECFLEAGDCRPANVQLERFSTLPELAKILKTDEYMAAEHARLSTWGEKLRRRLEKARRELRAQMPDPESVHRLKMEWLEETLSAMPGVADFHLFAGEKHSSNAEKRASNTSRARAIASFRWCARLRPEYPWLRVILISEFMAAEDWTVAISTADHAIKQFPRNAFICVLGGWAKYLFVVKAQGRKSLLSQAEKLMRKAVERAEQFTEDQLVAVYWGLAGCLDSRGKGREARRVLNKAVEENPAAARDVLFRAIRSSPAEFSKLLTQQAPQMLRRVGRTAASPELILGNVA